MLSRKKFKIEQTRLHGTGVGYTGIMALPVIGGEQLRSNNQFPL
jgi:hypothetical protein